jgi:hypothetical protein
MQGFQSRLAQLQEQMQAEPARYWRILPRDLEASVSA